MNSDGYVSASFVKIKDAINLRLNNHTIKDAYGNASKVFSDSRVESAINYSIATLQLFNIPISSGDDLIIQGAVIHLLSSQALIACGREFTQTDNGITVTPPKISEMLIKQWDMEYPMYFEKLRMLAFK